jgi:hypothetical protein
MGEVLEVETGNACMAVSPSLMRPSATNKNHRERHKNEKETKQQNPN